MLFMPSTTVSVARDTSDEQDEWGGDTETETGVYTRVPASITEMTEQVWNQSELRNERVEEFIIRLPARYIVQREDRITDNSDGSVYLVQTASRPQSVVGVTSSKLICKRIGSSEP